ncbi:hypothetical protein YC2023_122195 [Brassica napus]
MARTNADDDLKSKSLQAEFGEKRSFGRGFWGSEFFWFNGKLAQQSSEKVLKDAMKPSQNSSAYVYESWRRTESNRFFTRLLNDQVTFYTPGRDNAWNALDRLVQENFMSKKPEEKKVVKQQWYMIKQRAIGGHEPHEPC